ncbi:hypothetical protein O1C66_003571 [Vibrio cholerae]|uniref:hypothetical protein n=1 Tax=Vibrio tarriae TaxID=2014742 RepID=UPI0015EEA71E|nr:hypothetical protein [Vibrio tarriae]EKF9663295.1 hypothetical protein [Vibrio cholerae]
MAFLELMFEQWDRVIGILAVVAAFMSALAAFKSASTAKKSIDVAESQQKLILIQSISNSLQSVCSNVNVAKETKTTLDFAYRDLAIFYGQLGGSRQALSNRLTEQRIEELLPLERIAVDKLASISSFSALTLSELIVEQVNCEAFNQKTLRANLLLNQELSDVIRQVEAQRPKAT